jgi:hypothetical protein
MSHHGTSPTDPARRSADQVTDAVLDRILGAYHAAREVFADRAPARVEM